MSTYLWTLRSQTVKANDETGLSTKPLEIALFSFVTGHYGGWNGPSRHEAACEALAEQAWDKLAVNGKAPFVVQGDKEDIDKIRAGCGGFLTVFRDCTNKRWVDTKKFPADAVYGLLVKSGGRLAVRSIHVKTSDSIESNVKACFSGGDIPLTGTRTEVVDDTVRETMRQYALPNGNRVWVGEGDKEAMDCVKEDWAPIWKQREEAKAKSEADAKRRRSLSILEKEIETLMGEETELQAKMNQVQAKLQVKRQNVEALETQVERAA